jgi:formate hydrogenlyase subunit 6/NADH:ubiquinone oxidoreductase subunit I
LYRFTFDARDLDALITSLATAGYQVYGPSARSGAIRFEQITSLAELPKGITDRQGPGRYRLTRGNSMAYFDYVVGPSSIKDILFPPRRTVWRAVREDGSIRFVGQDHSAPPAAVIGVRACDLAAMRVQDTVFRDGPYVDPDYIARREQLFVVAVNCTTPAPTCFCTSMRTGPLATTGFDIALTEVIEDGTHHFVGEVGSERGAEALESVPSRPATTEEIASARYLVARAAGAITKHMQTEGLRDLLAANQNAGRWNSTAERCLACGNCTQVCPTCFCITTEDTVSLDGSEAGKERRWDSCFSLDYSFMGGKPVRQSVGSRYRHWLTHKLSSWVDQFGSYGCVGCGRCITWCPVGIDLTEEVAGLRATESVNV